MRPKDDTIPRFDAQCRIEVIQAFQDVPFWIALGQSTDFRGITSMCPKSAGYGQTPSHAYHAALGELAENFAIHAANHPSVPPCQVICGDIDVLRRVPALSFDLDDVHDCGSEGAAVGQTLEDAICRAACEKFERLAILHWWQGEADLAALAIDVDIPQGFDLALYVPRVDHPVTTVIARISNAQGITLGFAAGPHIGQTAQRATNEALAQALHLILARQQIGANEPLSSEAHAYVSRSDFLIAHRENLFKTLDQQPLYSAAALTLDSLKTALQAGGWQAGFVDLTLATHGLLPAARFVLAKAPIARSYFKSCEISPLI